MDRQYEGTIKILEDLLRACIIDFRASWDQFLPLAEFAYNNSYQFSIQMAPYEALYGRRYQLPMGLFEPEYARLLVTDLVRDSMEKAKVIQERLCIAQSRQKSYGDQKLRNIAYMVGENVLLYDTKNILLEACDTKNILLEACHTKNINCNIGKLVIPRVIDQVRCS
ncbi:uncharacterized protein [Nicotiana tomentosiformis]|uniref:uncharacterized protein n=1 Tax=Nicotiana tomentosiformis TaxID=4098 RepID=UPI00388CBA5A